MDGCEDMSQGGGGGGGNHRGDKNSESGGNRCVGCGLENNGKDEGDHVGDDTPLDLLSHVPALVQNTQCILLEHGYIASSDSEGY
jgi:hypothetical protein